MAEKNIELDSVEIAMFSIADAPPFLSTVFVSSPDISQAQYIAPRYSLSRPFHQYVKTMEAGKIFCAIFIVFF